ncbi:MAG: S-layer homology domain-containing protein, partial [Firmicutes bacterium]|nr:S-layer homology domain-containing protein [Bacillota bacterium]
MKQLAVVLAATLTLTLVAPAFAQPFADVPTDHWAYDAIAELAAKGLIEGYPDGAFRGDRAMTRYEMAMVVARLLARIEAIKIPPLPPDLVRRAELAKAQAAEAAARTALDKRLTAKLATVQRLVAEFRAELA